MRLICWLFLFLSLHVSGHAAEPIAVFLSWQDDPTRTMTINWISEQDETSDLVKFKHVNEELWQESTGAHIPMPHAYPAIVHHVKVMDLKPNSEYHFKIGNDGKRYKFKTLPKSLSSPLCFVVGGDVFHDSVEALEETNIQAAKTSPAFALQGGDLAYSSKKVKSWVTWMEVWTRTMITPDGCLIPIIPALGNHDAEGHYGDDPGRAPVFTALFRAPDLSAYYTFDVSDYLALTVLDSGHTNAIDGIQVDWLKDVLKKRAHYKHKFALYHLPAYPSVRRYDSKRAPIIRKHWVPLFDKYGLHVAFEHHDHCYKRSVPLRGGVEDPTGVLYLGDGAWGVTKPRTPKKKAEETWYLSKTASKRHFILVTLKHDSQCFEAIDHKGKRFDFYEIKIP